MGKVRYWTADLWIYRIGGLAILTWRTSQNGALSLLQLSPLY